MHRNKCKVLRELRGVPADPIAHYGRPAEYMRRIDCIRGNEMASAR